ncbi:hypothetical protein HNY73_021652 [Argiope bruennichi]|uniref:Uncharacterized protein n=1 Tax=Argiope bruennichi TaxID=94029 RepID=A0A8T0E063_ARGBR|nr:hypothetical protein HNY73_021652 [Argiope bruennichi]
MLKASYFIFLLLVFVCEICMITGDRCTLVTGTSGTIANEKEGHYYSKCWRFRVPLNSITRVIMESFNPSDTCEYTKVEVYPVKEDIKYLFCSDNSWKPIVLHSDFIVEHTITNFYDITSSGFSIKYESENTLCSQDNIFKCSDVMCIPRSQVCDGTVQCPDGIDEKGCDNTALLDRRMKETRRAGIQWLKKRWSHSAGWQENTHRAITALFLASERNDKNVEEKLMIKQLEVQALVYLLRKETDPLTANQLSMFVNALTVSCQNPYKFYANDLVKLLKDQTEVSSLIARPGAYLTLCNAGETLPVNATHDLGNLLKSDSAYSFFLDIQAVAIMALSCLQVNNERILNGFFPHTEYQEALTKLKQLQLEDGSFGTIYTTAVVTQALLSAGQQNSTDWNYNKAVNHLIQQFNSSTIDFLAVYLILPILNGKSLPHIGNTDCSTIMQRDPVAEAKDKLGPKMRVQYSLYIGDEKDIVHTISLRIPVNITVFEVMQLAQEADSKYKFRAKKSAEKLYIYDIKGIINDFEEGKFWLLYIGKDTESMTHTNKSPDTIILQDGAHIVMWYKKAHI